MSANKEYTITDYIKTYNEDSISFSTLHLKEVNTLSSSDKIVLLSDSILDKYDDVLKKYITTKTLTNEEYRKYQYNPKYLSYDLYGTTELWFLILHANQLYSITQFHINPIKIYTSDILKIIESILNLEKNIIDSNEDGITKALAE